MLLIIRAWAGRVLSLMLSGTMAFSVFASVAGGARAAVGDPYFSEYIEGPVAAFAKAVEIYNPSNAPIDLAAGTYTVEIYSNGGTGPTVINLSGILPAGEVFVLAHPTSAPEVLAVANQQSSSLNFNGNDAVQLRGNNTILDTIGQVGFDPGAAGWGTAPLSTTDSVLRRMSSVAGGSSDPTDAFDPALEWDAFLSTDYSDLGSYGPGAPTSDSGTVLADVTMAAAAACLELSDTSISFGTLGFGAAGQPASPSVTLTNCATAAETLLASATDAVGSTAAWSLVDSSATCADTLGIDNYRLYLDSPDLTSPVSLANLGKAVQTLAAGTATAHTAHIFTPCPGSSGDGQTLTFQINYLATE